MTRPVYSCPVLWYRMWPDLPVVMVRDLAGLQNDDYFFTTDLSARPLWVAECYAGRWSIEDTFRNTKQFLRGEDLPVLEGYGARASRRSLPLDQQRRLALVHHHAGHHDILAAASLVPLEVHSLVP